MNEETMTQLGAIADAAMRYTLEIGGALVIVAVGWIVAGWGETAVRRALARVQRLDPTVRAFFASVARYAILAFVLVAALNQVGVQTASIIAVIGATGLAIGLALQGTLQNVAAGLMLLLLRPFRVGDAITAGGISGAVVEIGLFTCELKTADGLYLMVPNTELWNKAIVNYSRNPTRRIDAVVGISYGDDVEGALALLLGMLSGDARVLKEPPPETMVTKLADSAVEITLRCWTHADDFWALTFFLNKEAKARLEAAGFSIPFPQRDVHVIQEVLKEE